MGCDDTREDIEEKMLYAHLEREDVRRQRKLLLEQLKLSTGEVYESEKIPDFVDIKYIKEKKRKHYEKLVKQEVKKYEEKKKKEQKKREELEKELEEERKKEQLLYMPLDMKIKNQNSDLEDIYYLNYVLDKKQKENKKDKEKDKDKKHKKNKKDKKKKKGKHHRRHSVATDEEEEEEEEDDKEDKKYDYIEPVNAKIRTKIGSVKSVLGNNEDKKDEDDDNDDSDSEKKSKNMPYVTPHLQPND
jgi:hypothetical protein